MRPAALAWNPEVSVLNALAHKAFGAFAAFVAAPLRPPRSSTPNRPSTRPNWFVVSMTIRPASASGPPAWVSASSTADQGTASTTTSAWAAASRADAARASMPAAKACSSASSRVKLTTTSCPDFVNRRARFPPMRPAPMMPMRVMVIPSGQSPSISMTCRATARPEYCCCPVISRPSRIANALNRPAWT